MASYIEREALIAELAKGTIIPDDLYGMGIMSGVDFAMKKLVEFPAADVVEVVHCRDCRHLENGCRCYCPLGSGVGYDGGYMMVDEDDFCSYGERKADNDS